MILISTSNGFKVQLTKLIFLNNLGFGFAFRDLFVFVGGASINVPNSNG